MPIYLKQRYCFCSNKQYLKLNRENIYVILSLQVALCQNIRNPVRNLSLPLMQKGYFIISRVWAITAALWLEIYRLIFLNMNITFLHPVLIRTKRHHISWILKNLPFIHLKSGHLFGEPLGLHLKSTD